MDQIVFTALSQVLSGQNPALAQAQAQLESMASSMQPGYPETLARFILDPNLPLPERQLAGTTLKGVVSKYWRKYRDEDGEVREGVEVPPEAKAFIKQSVLAGISDRENRVRVLMAAIATEIIDEEEGLDLWPDLFTSLVTNLQSRSPEAIHGAMRVLTEAVESLSEKQFSSVAPLLIPEVYKVFCSENLYSNRTRARAVGVFCTFVKTVNKVKVVDKDVVGNYLVPLLPAWMDAMGNVALGFELSNDKIILKTRVFQALETLLETCPNQMKPYMPNLIPLVWKHIQTLQPVYLATIINSQEGDDDIHGGVYEQDSDGDVQGVTQLLFTLFAILGVAVMKSSLKKFFVVEADGKAEEPSDLLKEIIGAAFVYGHISNSQIETWESNPNEFVADQEGETTGFTMRFCMEDLLGRIVEKYMVAGVKAIAGATQNAISEGNHLKARGDRNWWKLHETTFFVLGLVSSEMKSAFQSGKIQFDFMGLLDHVVIEDIKQGDSSVLQGRALQFASIFDEVLTDAQARHFIEACAHLIIPTQPFPARIGAIIAIRRFSAVERFTPLLVPFAAAILESVCNMVTNANEDLLFLLLEVLGQVVRFDEGVTARYEEPLIQLLATALTKDDEDILKNECVLDVFKALAKNAVVLQALQTRLLPSLLHTMSDYRVNETRAVTYVNALVLVTLFVRSNSSPLPPVYVNVLPPLFNVMMVSGESMIMQEGQDLLKALILKDFNSVAQWSDGTKTGLNYILDIIARLLADDADESGSMFVGSLITALIQKGGDALGPIIPQILAAIVRRLNHVKISMAIVNLILVFAHFIQDHMQTVIEFLSTLTIPAASGSGESVKVNMAALAKLFASGDPRLGNVLVQGGVLETGAGGDPPRYTKIPFPAKALSLLLSDYQQQRKMPKVPGGMLGDGGDDDETTEDTVGTEFSNIEFNLFLCCRRTTGKMTRLTDDFLDGLDDEDDNFDAELMNPAISELNGEEFLKGFFKNCAQHNVFSFNAVAEQYLLAKEKKLLTGVLAA
ncbi:Importin 9 [Blyttiomyces sp. JEL0837]|nr:Importin 9 [Blyttiomyces sp. JEL0837]